MRFKRIKLAGFKSFVDPTVVEFPSALVGVAGPNGSGKSNVIDAVRWVMGESSARHLRGGQMADVIFNGSAGRQPLGSAAVEMVFDNSDGRLGGEYADWSEIAIRRTVDREGVSGYYLNGTRCRRKDITDIFLGTGLGPRSYAIIEQGMISRLVESRPEELREFLEETAGISRYKERRRETETRIRHTRENLERVEDLLDEVGKRLAHLRRQARAAERYQQLKADERRLRAELLALRMQALDGEAGSREEESRTRTLAVEAEVTRERGIERDLAAARAAHDDAVEAANRIQQSFFELQTEVARLEEAIAGARRERQLREERLQALQEQLAENERRGAADAERAARLRAEVERLEPELLAAEARMQRAREIWEAGEAALLAHQQADAEHRERTTEARLALDVAQTRAGAAAEREQGLRARIQRLIEERRDLEDQAMGQASEAAREDVTRLRREAEATEIAAEEAESRVRESRERLRQSAEALFEARHELASVEGRLASLEQLARAEHAGEEAGQWLAERGLSNARRLAADIRIDAGWEWAVEVALGAHLGAVDAGASHARLEDELRRLGGGQLTLVTPGDSEPAPAESLAARAASPFPAVRELLARIRTADDYARACELRTGLGEGETVITPDGVWMGRHWMRVARASGEDAGVIGRERERESLARRRDELAEAVTAAERNRERAEESLHRSEEHYAEARGTARGAQEALSAGLAAEAEAAGRERSAVERIDALARELTELEESVTAAEAEGRRTGEAVERSRRALEALEDERDSHEEALTESRAAARHAREQADGARAAREALALRLESARAQAQAAAETAERLRTERESLAAERERLASLIGEMGEPGTELQTRLQQRLDAHREIDSDLARARDHAAGIEARVNELERSRRAAAARVEELREDLQSARLAAQELKTRREGIAGQLAELETDPERVLAELEEGAEVGEWERRLEQTGGRIQRLGAINLAAIDECASEAQREDYLKRQRDDLAEALETLENAIHRIDRETRTRFKDTFERLNARLSELFPRLFGGGEAALVLTGEELLDAGVVVTARPPGKKNATIQMLSGGEKALVAVALVFAIFELNPAPFCMLDEVDAPMDDANVERFCDLVREMSERTQFVLITHNRRTMAMCRQLVGVTMAEPGVSRLVGVDIDEAVRLAVG